MKCTYNNVANLLHQDTTKDHDFAKWFPKNTPNGVNPQLQVLSDKVFKTCQGPELLPDLTECNPPAPK